MADTIDRDRSARRRSLTPPLLVAAAGVAFSLLFSTLIYPRIDRSLSLNLDPDRCGVLAGNIASGRGYVYAEGEPPAVDRGPAYPAFLAVLRLATGTDAPWVIQAVQALLHGATAFLVYGLLLRSAGRRAAIIAQLLTALHPMLIWYSARVWTETFFTFLVTAVIVLHGKVLARPGEFAAAAGGAVAGLASLTKGIFLPWGLLAGGLLLARKGRGALRPALLLAFVPFLVVLPWTIRNAAVTGALVPVHTLLGANMINGDAVRDSLFAHPGSSSALYAVAQARRNSLLEGTGWTMEDPAGDRRLLEASLRENISRPGLFLRKLLLNAATFWYLGESPEKSLFLALIQAPLVAVVVLALFRLRGDTSALPLLLMVGLFWVLHALVNGWARYSAPLLPACLALSMLLRRSPRRQDADPGR